MALSAYVNNVATYCSSRGYDLLPGYTGDTRGYCHNHKSEYTSDNYEYFYPVPVVVSPVCTDADGDGYSTDGGSCGPLDCNDYDCAVNPVAVEVCGDGMDNNCNGSIDTADLNAVGCVAGCADRDGDAFSPDGGNCGPIDCNDNNPEINPGALEICNDGSDNNCNNKTDCSDGVCQDPQAGNPHSWRPGANGESTGGSADGNTGTTHPFGWTNPGRQHRSYVGYNGVLECLSCRSIDTASRYSALSCFNCHGKVWDDPSSTGGSSSSEDGEDRNDVGERSKRKKSESKKKRKDD